MTDTRPIPPLSGSVGDIGKSEPPIQRLARAIAYADGIIPGSEKLDYWLPRASAVLAMLPELDALLYPNGRAS